MLHQWAALSRSSLLAFLCKDLPNLLRAAGRTSSASTARLRHAQHCCGWHSRWLAAKMLFRNCRPYKEPSPAHPTMGTIGTQRFSQLIQLVLVSISYPLTSTASFPNPFAHCTRTDQAHDFCELC